MKTSKYSVSGLVRRLFLAPLLALTLLLTSYDRNETIEPKDDRFTVVLDAGHGGHDPGNLGNGYLEKNIALNIVLKAGSILEKNADIKVIYTRKDDTFIDLYVRGEIANKANADLFVSVHCDSHTSNAHGAGTFVLGLHANKQNFEIAKKENSVIYLEDDYQSRYADYDINSPESVIGLTIMQEEFLDQSIALAKAIQDNFSNKLKRSDRKVKQAGFIVLHQTFMPSVLVETGFLTNKEEGAYLNSRKGQSEMGASIADAILNYKKSALSNIADYSVNTTPNVTQDDVAEKEEVVDEKSKDVVRNTSEPKPADKTDPIVSKENKEVIAVNSEKKAAQIIEEAQEKSKGQVLQPDKTETLQQNSESEKTSSPTPKADVIYKVQIMATAKSLPLRPESFNGLNRVAKEPYKNLFRYVYGSTKSLEEAQMMKSNADRKGYPTSFIVAYRDGERIPFKESLK